MIAQLEFFEKQLVDAHIEKLFSRMEHPIKTIPGIGSITGPLIAAELGDLRRFAGRRPLHASWPMLAWTPAFARVANGAAKSK